MYYILLVSIFIPVVPFDYNEYGVATKRISGRPCEISQYPFVVSIRNTMKPEEVMCEGSLIRADWVLTAAHCLYANDPENLYVIAGVTNVAANSEKSHAQVADVALIVNHEKFTITESVVFDDISLIKLKSHIELGPYAALAMFPSKGYTAQQKVAVAVGWGSQSIKEFGKDGTDTPAIRSKKSRHLNCVQVSIINKTHCENHWDGFLQTGQGLDNKTQFCTLSPQTEDACKGYPGSPLAVGGIVIGIVSIGRGCDQKLIPTINTRVEGYLDFINNTLFRYKGHRQEFRHLEGRIDGSIVRNADGSSIGPTNRCDRVHKTAYLFNGIIYCISLVHLVTVFGCNLFVNCK